MPFVRTITLASALALSPTAVLGQLVVMQPDGVNDRIAAGNDFATQVVGNSWDMDRLADVVTTDSGDFANQSVSNGIFSANGGPLGDASLYLLYTGIGGTVNLANGARFAISTSTYRYLTVKFRVTNPNGTTLPPSNPPQAVAYWYRDAPGFPNTFGLSQPALVNIGQWQVTTFDLTQLPLQGITWTSSATMRGLRFDPVQIAGLRIEVDWARLTSGNVASSQRYTITWSDSGSGPYTISAVDSGGVPFVLATGVTGNAFNADLSRLQPGNYLIRVSRSGASDDSNGPLTINTPPQFEFTSPSERGEQSQNFALAELADPWGPIEASDVLMTSSISNLSYGNPVGSLTGRPTSGDSGVIFNTRSTPIDTARYKSLCYTLQVAGPRDIGLGSVARIFWGNSLSSMTTSDDIIVEAGLNTYCFADIGAIPLEPGGPIGWTGSMQFVRLDPHEFEVSSACNSAPSTENCRDIRIDNFVLSPLANANPSYTFRWNHSDPDPTASTITLRLDLDRDPANGNEALVVSQATAPGSGLFAWTATNAYPSGRYEVQATIDDGANAVTQYATGPIVVGPIAATGITVTQPASTVPLPAATDYAAALLGNRLDMSESGDLNLGRTFNLANQSIASGRYSGTSTNGDPALIVIEPSQSRPAIPTNDYRFLTAKMRVAGGSGTHFAAVFFFRDGSLANGSVGYTSGKVVPPGSWQIVSFDLVADRDPTSPNGWNDQTQMPVLRFDPTTVSGASVEIDWITLTGALNPASNYTILWTSSALGAATVDVHLLDQDGTEFLVASGLPGTVTSAATNPGRLGLGSYVARVRASPGPTGLSPGSLITSDTPNNPAVLFASGFE
jgi:hypothetical protein